jgi:hypothetical protein
VPSCAACAHVAKRAKLKLFKAPARLRESNSRSHGFGILGLVLCQLENMSYQLVYNPKFMLCDAMCAIANWHFFKLVVMLSSTNCKFRMTRSISIKFSSLVKIQLLPIKQTLFSIEKKLINVEFSTEMNSPISKNLQTKVPPMDSLFIEIQIWQS